MKGTAGEEVKGGYQRGGGEEVEGEREEKKTKRCV